jgi:hypothetical protein
MPNMQTVNLNIDNLNRAQIRSKLLKVWESELPGSGQYRYNVEQCADDSKIYLLRPANLNKGCDFKIISENFKKWKNGNDKAPKHDDVFELIRNVLSEDLSLKDDIVSTLESIYNCKNTCDVFFEYPRLLATQECKAERALKLLKWMWIEQDITYWTGEGRQMLKRGIDDLLSSL